MLYKNNLNKTVLHSSKLCGDKPVSSAFPLTPLADAWPMLGTYSGMHTDIHDDTLVSLNFFSVRLSMETHLVIGLFYIYTLVSVRLCFFISSRTTTF